MSISSKFKKRYLRYDRLIHYSSSWANTTLIKFKALYRSKKNRVRTSSGGDTNYFRSPICTTRNIKCIGS